MKGSGAFSRSHRPILSQSLSFPAKGVCTDNMTKSIEEHPLRTAAKHARDEGTKVKVSFPHVSVTSSPRLNQANRRVPTGVNSRESSNINCSKTLTRQSSSTGKSCSQQATVRVSADKF
jgi:hypothetical protein